MGQNKKANIAVSLIYIGGPNWNWTSDTRIFNPLFEDLTETSAGLELEGLDGNITHNMLKLAGKLNIPIIPIHEECLCKEEDKEKNHKNATRRIKSNTKKTIWFLERFMQSGKIVWVVRMPLQLI